EVAEIPYTAFTSRRKADHISARLIVRRVKRLNPKTVPQGQGELFSAYRHHAIVEQVIADFKGGALAHLPSGNFASNGAWLVLAAIAFNLTRAAGTIASVFHAKATTPTIRRQLIAVPGRLARSARKLVIHLPKDWPWQDSWEGLFNATCGPPTPATTRPPSPNRAQPKTPVETPRRPAAISRAHGAPRPKLQSPTRQYFSGGSRFRGRKSQTHRKHTEKKHFAKVQTTMIQLKK